MTLTGRHVLLAALAFFGVIAAVNGGMIYFAVSTFSGIETENAYLRGLAYNETLQAAERQEALGWTVSFQPRQLEGRQVALEASFRDRHGRPLDELEVQVGLSRPTHQGYDHDLVLAASGGGRYSADAALPLAGQWDLRLRAQRGGKALYSTEQRFWLK